MALAHVIENKVEAAYRRCDLSTKRRKMMRFVGRLPGAAQDGRKGRSERNGGEAFGRSSIFRLRPSGVRYVEGDQCEPERSPPCRRYGPPSAFPMPPRQRRQPLVSAAVTAMLDRLLHHGHILKCGPRSWRTKTGLPSPLQKG